MSKNTLRVRVKAKAQNAILARLSDKEGGCKQAAHSLGVSAATFSAWLNFRGTPWGKNGNSYTRMKSKRALELVLKLEKLTGESICDIFPISKKQLEPLAAVREYERDVELAALENYAQEQAVLLEENINEGQRNLEQAEAKLAIDEAMKTLTDREAKVLTLRYGLDGSKPLALRETGEIIGVTQERVRQIESKAIRKLKQSPCTLAFHY